MSTFPEFDDIAHWGTLKGPENYQKCSNLAFWGYFGHFEDSAVPRGILSKVFFARIPNSIYELTLS